MENKFEPKIGDVFTYHSICGDTITVRTDEGQCADCDFIFTEFCGSYKLLCLPDERSDKKHVAFKRIVEWKEK